MRRVITLLAVSITCATGDVAAETIRVTGTRPSKTGATVAVSAVSPNKSFSTKRTSTSSASTFEVRADKRAQLGFLTVKQDYVPVVFAVKKGGKIYSFSKAVSEKICKSGTAKGHTTLKKSISKSTYSVVSSGGEQSFGYLKRFSSKGNSLADIVDQSFSVALDKNCAPKGNARNDGQSTSSSSAIKMSASASSFGDSDSDSIPDIFDVDTDGDGVLNPYERSFSPSFGAFLFSLT